MRKLISLFLILSLNAYGQSEPITRLKLEGSGTFVPGASIQVPNNSATKINGSTSRLETGNSNLLVNPSFEATVPSTGWTLTNATSAANTSFKLEGSQSLQVTPTVAGGGIKQSVTLNAASLLGSQGVVEVPVRTSGTDVKVCFLANNVRTYCKDVPAFDSTSAFKTIVTPITFDGTSNGIEVYSTGTSVFIVDEIKIGRGLPLQNVSGYRSYGTLEYPVAANCSWLNGSTSFIGFPADTDCATPVTTGNIKAPSTKIPAFVLPSGSPAGTYFVVASGYFRKGGSTVDDMAFQLHDGTNALFGKGASYAGSTVASTLSLLNAQVTYSSALTSDKTIELQAQVSNAGTTNANINAQNVPSGIPLQFQIYYLPPESKIYSDKLDWFIDANIGGANIATNTNSSYVEATSASLDLVLNTAKGSASAEIACASGTASIGLTCNTPAVNESVGIAFVPPRTGRYKACFTLSSTSNNQSGTSGQHIFQVVETSNTSSAIITEGGERVYGIGGNTGANLDVYSGTKVCGKFNFTDTSKKTIRLMYEQTATGNGAGILADRSASLGQRDIHISVEIEKAEIIGSFAGIEKCANDYECTDTFSAKVTSTGVVSDENLDWINGNFTVSPAGTFTATLNTNLKDGTSALSNPMNCVVVQGEGTGGTGLNASFPVSPNTASTLVVTTANSGSPGSYRFVIKCQKAGQDYKPKTAKVASSIGVPTVPGITTTGTGNSIDTFIVSFGTTNGTTPCTASPCSYLDQIGSAVSNITRSTTATYALNTTKTYAKLKCTGSAANATNFLAIGGTSSSMTCTNCNSLGFQTGTSVTAADGFGTLYCQGSY